MTYVKIYLLITFGTRVENLKRDLWVWSRDPSPFVACGKRRSKNPLSCALLRLNSTTNQVRV